MISRLEALHATLLLESPYSTFDDVKAEDVTTVERSSKWWNNLDTMIDNSILLSLMSLLAMQTVELEYYISMQSGFSRCDLR